MKHKTVLILALAATLSVGGLAVLKTHAAANAPRRTFVGKFWERAKEKLDLAQDQVRKIKVELKAEKETLIKLARQLHAAKIGVREAIQKDGATVAEVRAAAANLGEAEADLAVERLKLHGKIKPILTAEQWLKLAELQDKLDDFVDGVITVIGERIGE